MVEIQGLVKKYGNNYALDGISFTINDGEIVGFLGPNGAGKSTTMNIITGYLSASAGTVKIDGHDIFEEPIEAKRLIGFLPEQPPLYVDMTVWEYLSFVYDLKECKFNKSKHIEEICRLVKIFDVKDRLIKNLSKGYKQRVGIAQALVGNPKFIIFDEPTVGLDPKQIIEIRNLIRALGKKHTVILSTHILPEVQAVCDRIVIINEGKIIADQKTSQLSQLVGNEHTYRVKIAGPQREVRNLLRRVPGVTRVTEEETRDRDAYSYIIDTSSAVDVRKPLFNALAENGWPLVGIEGVEAELEDLFVKLIDKSKQGGN